MSDGRGRKPSLSAVLRAGDPAADGERLAPADRDRILAAARGALIAAGAVSAQVDVDRGSAAAASPSRRREIADRLADRSSGGWLASGLRWSALAAALVTLVVLFWPGRDRENAPVRVAEAPVAAPEAPGGDLAAPGRTRTSASGNLDPGAGVQAPTPAAAAASRPSAPALSAGAHAASPLPPQSPPADRPERSGSSAPAAPARPTEQLAAVSAARAGLAPRDASASTARVAAPTLAAAVHPNTPVRSANAAAVASATRRLDLVAPGGTRVVWVLDSELTL